VELLADQTEGSVRRLTFNIQAAPEVNNVIVYIEPAQLLGEAILDSDFTIEWNEIWPVLRYYNLNSDGFTLTVPAAAEQPFTVKILAQMLQLPKLGLLPRPENIISAPTGITDCTVTIRSYQF